MINNPIIYGGGALDPLGNPASASDIIAGKEAYSDSGAKLTGTMVDPTPTKGLVFENYNADGYPTSCRFVGTWSGTLPSFYSIFVGPEGSSYFKFIESMDIPEGITKIATAGFYSAQLSSVTFPTTLTTFEYNAFYQARRLTSLTFPNSVSSFGVTSFAGCTGVRSITFEGHVPNISNGCFMNSTGMNVELYDFSHHSGEIPSLSSVASLGHKAGCVIKVPQALLADWQNATNWNALTDVVWQGV